MGRRPLWGLNEKEGSGKRGPLVYVGRIPVFGERGLARTWGVKPPGPAREI